MNPEFQVIVGKNGFKIQDTHGVTYGSYSDRDDADHYCRLLNLKWESIATRPL